MHIIQHQDATESEYPPIGRFGWRDRYFVRSKVEELTHLTDNFELVKAGCLQKNELMNLVAKIDDTLKNERFR